MAALLSGAAPSAALAQTPGSQTSAESTLTLVPPNRLPPPGRTKTAEAMIAKALAVPRIAAVRREHPGSFARAYLKDVDRWQVSVFERRGRSEREIGQVILDDRSGRVLEAWTGIQVAWTMARGYEGAFGRRANALYIWLPLLALFLLPFLRPPYRLVHLDLAAVAALSVSFAFFDDAQIGLSVPLAYPPLVYLMVRMLLLARRRARRGAGDLVDPAPLRLLVGPEFLGMAIIFLLGFRLGLNITSSNVIDVGYAGVIGADRIAHGQALYGHFPADNAHGDTYGPVVYLAYLPFELLFPWHGEWDDLPAAHVVAVVFDLACAAGLWLAGRRLRGPVTGRLLAFLWLACPFTLVAVNSATNDAIVGALVLAAFLAASRPAARGAAIGAAAMAKFAPIALAPLFATWGVRPGDGRRAVLRFALGAGAVIAACLVLIVALDGGLRGFWDRTIAFQAGRESPFSLWGYYDIPAIQHVVQLAAAGLALAVAVFPRRRDDPIVLAALAAAVLLALQLGVTHWFYLYVVWFLPLVLVASVGEVMRREVPAAAPARSTRLAAAPARSG